MEGGGGESTPCPQLNSFFFLKEKMMQNVLKRENMYLENMYLEGFQVILHFSPQNHTAKKRTGGGGGAEGFILFDAFP
jgi:hypothetical protein